MKKVMIIGCPGSGKSTFARALRDITGLPLFYLDMLYWNADRTTVSKEEFRRRLGEVIAKECWIIDGNYGSTLEMRMEACDTVFFLDYPPEVCLEGVRQRRGKPREDMPWIEVGEDAEFLQFIRDYKEVSRPKVLALLEKYADKTVFVFSSREDAAEYLARL
ncbi:MAG: adenylate kinase [Clostridia bacterium]|nr:adenylate kinase [Clostridia bacterium]